MAIGTPRRKYVRVHLNDDNGAGFNPRVTRAYAEGRAGIPATGNPFPLSSPTYIAWFLGDAYKADADYKFECST